MTLSSWNDWPVCCYEVVVLKWLQWFGSGDMRWSRFSRAQALIDLCFVEESFWCWQQCTWCLHTAISLHPRTVEVLASASVAELPACPVVLHFKVNLHQKTSDSWRLRVKIFTDWLFLAIISEWSCCWKWWSGFKFINFWAIPKYHFFFFDLQEGQCGMFARG